MQSGQLRQAARDAIGEATNVDNSVKLPVAALSVALFFCVLTIGSLVVRTSGGGGSDPAAAGATLFTLLGCQG